MVDPVGCKVCRHKNRKQIEKMLFVGEPFDKICKRFRIRKKGRLSYHKANCMRIGSPRRREFLFGPKGW